MHNAILQSVAEQLMEDERLRSHLDDDEAKIVLDWAMAWLGAQVNAAADAPAAAQIASAELARVRDALKAMNVAAKESSAAMPQILAALCDAQSKSSPAQVLAMLNAPVPRANR
ncbi:MAG: hypothetical protein HY327_09020 [Chloroflexi bacterium]|nr:hypothetical protein [Chloroflexota bacterium]